MRQHGDRIGAGEPGRECRDGRAQHVHVRVTLGQHAPGRIGGNEQRLRRQPARRLDARPQQPQCAEFCHGQKLVGIRREPRIDHVLRLLQWNAGALDRAQIGDAAGQHERELLHLGAAGIVDHAPVGGRERSLEAERGEPLMAPVTAGTISSHV